MWAGQGSAARTVPGHGPLLSMEARARGSVATADSRLPRVDRLRHCARGETITNARDGWSNARKWTRANRSISKCGVLLSFSDSRPPQATRRLRPNDHSSACAACAHPRIVRCRSEPSTSRFPRQTRLRQPASRANAITPPPPPCEAARTRARSAQRTLDPFTSRPAPAGQVAPSATRIRATTRDLTPGPTVCSP